MVWEGDIKPSMKSMLDLFDIIKNDIHVKYMLHLLESYTRFTLPSGLLSPGWVGPPKANVAAMPFQTSRLPPGMSKRLPS